MYLLHKKRTTGTPPPPSGGQVRIAGGDPAANYVSAIAGLADSAGWTIAMRFNPVGVPVRLSNLFGMHYGGATWGGGGAATTRPLFVGTAPSNFGGNIEINGTETIGADEDCALFVSFDPSATNLGDDGTDGYKGRMWVNGVDDANTIVGGTGNIRCNNDQPFHLFNGPGGGALAGTLDVTGVIIWAAALNPDTYYSTVFDGAGDFQAGLGAAGTVNGVVPSFKRVGANAAEWLTETDDNGIGYTFTGTLTDTP